MVDSGLEKQIKPSISEAYRENLGRAFRSHLGEIVEQRRNDRLRIISVGCGFGYEAEPILRLLPNATYKGIDIKEVVIHGARSTNADIHRAEFEVADAREPTTFGDKPWDIVILRNPQVLGSYRPNGYDPEDWERIISNSISALAEGGILFITTEDVKQEKEEIKRQLRVHGVTIKEIVNEFYTEKGFFRDPYIILGEKA